MYTNDRNAYRKTYIDAWQKYQKKLPLQDVEAQLIEIILLHPEYQRFLEVSAEMERQEFTLEENPFFHMSLHLAIREQIHTNRPAGIAAIYKDLQSHYQDTLRVEHAMMDCLAQMIWRAQQTGNMPDDNEYLNNLKAIPKI